MNCLRTGKQTGGTTIVFRLAIPMVAVLVGACSQTDALQVPSPSDPITLTIGYPHVTGQDPLHGMQQGARLVSLEGLVLPSRTGRVQPRIAEAWTESPDGLTWTFRLRSNALFHDGSPVNSSVVKDSIERSLAGSDSFQYPGLTDITSIDAPTPYELVVHLRARSTFLLDDLGISIIKPVPGKTPLGTGPYVTITTDADELVMERFPKYYGGAPQIDRIVWKAYPAVRTAWAAMMRGEVDFLYEVGPEAVQFMQGQTSVNVFPFLRSYSFGVILNSRRPEFSDSRVRRALNYAIDRDAIVAQALNGHGQPASGAAWPQHWAFDSTLPPISYDPARAAALLNGADLPPEHSKGGAPARIHFTCIIPENFALWERMGLLVQRNLAEIGVDMQLQALPVDEFNQRIGTGNFDAVLTEFVVGNSVSRSYFFWHSQGKLNYWGYRNPRMDSALDGIRRAPGESEYREAYRSFQTENIEDPPAIFLALGEITRAVSRRFEVVAPPGTDILPTIADWRPAPALPRTSN